VSRSSDPSSEPSRRLVELAGLFLKLGATSFGGPAAHVAMMEDEVVRRRGWLTRERFLDLLGATNLIPGPNSTELAIHVGHIRAGWRGLVVAGACFVLPAFLIVLGCAWVYVRAGSLPAAEGVLYGVKPVIVAVVVQALWGLGAVATKTPLVAGVGIVSAALTAAGVHELAVLFGAGAVVGGWAWARRARSAGRLVGLAPLLPWIGAPIGAGAAAAPFGLGPLFLFFLKVGSVLFGSGYVLLAFLRADLVERWGWLTEAQLLDAIAVGQVTPGPVFTTATFVGFVLGGLPGAVVATVGIFLPAFVFVAMSAPLVPCLRRSAVAGAVLDGLNVASVALMTVATAQLLRVAVVDVVTAVLAVTSAALLIGPRVGSVWLVLAGGLVGVVVHR
jgi:chromate transporter